MSAHSTSTRSQLLTLLCAYVARCPAAKASLSAYSDAKGRCLASLVVHARERVARLRELHAQRAQRLVARAARVRAARRDAPSSRRTATRRY